MPIERKIISVVNVKVSNQEFSKKNRKMPYEKLQLEDKVQEMHSNFIGKREKITNKVNNNVDGSKYQKIKPNIDVSGTQNQKIIDKNNMWKIQMV